MKHVTTVGLKLWEVGLNNYFSDFYDILYRPTSDRNSCFEAVAEFRGFVTGLWYSGTISGFERDLLCEEIHTMINLIFDVKPH